jgi:hypothetical protein
MSNRVASLADNPNPPLLAIPPSPCQSHLSPYWRLLKHRRRDRNLQRRVATRLYAGTPRRSHVVIYSHPEPAVRFTAHSHQLRTSTNRNPSRGKTRLAKWYVPYSDDEKIKLKGEVCLSQFPLATPPLPSPHAPDQTH